MLINLTPHSIENPTLIEEELYLQLVHRKQKGWSHCDSEEEWLAKLHYLRKGFHDGKIALPQFLERESQLLFPWLRKRT